MAASGSRKREGERVRGRFAGRRPAGRGPLTLTRVAHASRFTLVAHATAHAHAQANPTASARPATRGESASFARRVPSREGLARPSEASGEEVAGGGPKGGANPPRVPISKIKQEGELFDLGGSHVVGGHTWQLNHGQAWIVGQVFEDAFSVAAAGGQDGGSRQS
jgi:hypothetical protein